MRVFIIAEAGVNHNGKLGLAKELVNKAKEAGVDCIKFQTFKSENCVTTNAEKAVYQRQATGAGESQLKMLRKLELSFDDFIELKNYCEMQKITFLSTPFDLESIDFLANLGMEFWKIP
ncbi:MAG TPA: N-acetylneuraminate synthase, partial [Clostridia bacterium]|nr:N-acetylneuraminate synthase [Clostridia bacterium]